MPENQMAATNKADLIAITEKEWAKLTKTLDTVSPDIALTKVDDMSIKDTVGHRAHWIALFLGWYHDGRTGKDVHIPAKGYKWNELKRYNADLRQKQADLTWEDARVLLTEKAEELLKFMHDQTDEALYGGSMKGGNGKWTTGRFAEASGPSHYRSATKYIKDVLRQLDAA
ncbi:ClbS/DfsB family four-helix bundle protein [Yoonia sp. 2307UL14-13]|uniref:ClbS/DfsB family four-helix bundle protein n=1 Tax=Yoonia sp. 2307UL14-13 TaxID=3126506 RepID=UPI0030A01F46